MTVRLCAPLWVEHTALASVADGMRLVRTGMGPTRAAARRAELGGDEPVLVAGLGGTVADGPRPGDLVVADRVRGAGAEVPIPSAPLLAGALRGLGLRVYVGPIDTVPRIAGRRAAERARRDGALAVDMESAHLAPAPGVPFAVVRAVVDCVGHPLASPGMPLRGITALRALRAAGPALAQWAAAIGPREVRLAGPRSFCAGVSRAIDTVRVALKRFGAPVYVRRQIVHNTHVVRQLRAEGAVFVEEVGQIPPGAVTVFAAHGVAPPVRREAADRRLRVIDATCPLVTKVHTEIRRYAGRGETVFLIGHHEHEEVQGSRGEAPDEVVVVPDVTTARAVVPPDPNRVAYTMQTTLAVDEAERIADVLRERFPLLSAPRTDDICYATTNRQRALRAVARQVDLVLVVGSPNSSNSRRLVEVAEREGAPAHLIEDVGEIDLRWLAGAGRVGLTAGASAPPHLLDQVVHGLSGLGPVRAEEIRLVEEDVMFTLPREVS